MQHFVLLPLIFRINCRAISTLTNNVEQNPSSWTDSSAAIQEIPHILQNQKVCYDFHKSQLLVHILSQINLTLKLCMMLLSVEYQFLSLYYEVCQVWFWTVGQFRHVKFQPVKWVPVAAFHSCVCVCVCVCVYVYIRGLLEKYPTFGREKETGLLGALDT
jgi:hypothetical protein